MKKAYYAGIGALLFVPAFAATAPAISKVQNNYSYLLPGVPNYGIAPGTLFLITGTDLADPGPAVLQSSAAPGLPLTLNNASISVTVTGTTTHPAIYYATPTAIAAVLPSSTPTGAGTITVTWNGIASDPAPIRVVPTALGFDTFGATGSVFEGVATDISGGLFGPNKSAKPGQTIVLWGSGLGAASDSDTVYTLTPHAVNTPLQVLIGGIQANVLYAGSSGYPGVNQINVVVPAAIQPGCGVAIIAFSSSIVSNTVSIPVSASGGPCADPLIEARNPFATTRQSYRVGSLAIAQTTNPQGTTSSASGNFFSLTGATYLAFNPPISAGNCFAQEFGTGLSTSGGGVTTTGLDAGLLTLTGPSGTRSLPPAQGPAGNYIDIFPDGFLGAAGGSFSFTGSGGKDVGPFSVNLNFPPALVWTNRNALSNVSRGQGVTFTWAGGAPQTYVTVSGISTSGSGANAVSAGFACNIPVGAGQFTVPPAFLLGMPPGGGSLNMQNLTLPVPFTATSIDYGYLQGSFSEGVVVSYE